jgi:hypothetical protein
MRSSFDPDAPVALHERSIGTIDPGDWDRFVLACGGSFLGSWKVIRAERLRHTVRVFEFFRAAEPAPLKVGQCAVAISGRQVRFLDRLHMLPRHCDLWAPAVQEVVARCGHATYLYGSPWNHEQRSAAAGAMLPPGRLVDDAFRLDAVAFAAWPGFAAYRRDVSENIRRDYKKAAVAAPAVVIRRGAAALRDLPGLVRLRRQVMRRKGERFSMMVDAPLQALKLLCMGEDAFIATVVAQGRRHAAFFGVEFGDGIYYLAGGTKDKSEGFGSFLFLTLIEQWFARHPQGTLYLGEQTPGVDPQTYTYGNLLYRRKLRASSVEGTAFTLYVR